LKWGAHAERELARFDIGFNPIQAFSFLEFPGGQFYPARNLKVKWMCRQTSGMVKTIYFRWRELLRQAVVD
jgi:hypothetical protein